MQSCNLISNTSTLHASGFPLKWLVWNVWNAYIEQVMLASHVDPRIHCALYSHSPLVLCFHKLGPRSARLSIMFSSIPSVLLHYIWQFQWLQLDFSPIADNNSSGEGSLGRSLSTFADEVLFWATGFHKAPLKLVTVWRDTCRESLLAAFTPLNRVRIRPLV